MLQRVDVVLELRDARIPLASINPNFDSLFKDRRRIIVLNKAGLADEAISKEWSKHFTQMGTPVILVDVKDRKGLQALLPAARALMQDKWNRFRQKDIRPPALRLMIVGIPNVGKSSLINALTKKHKAKTGPLPGVTRRNEWIILDKDVELLDTPGVLWPKLDHPWLGHYLGVTGAIKDSVAGEKELALFLLEKFLNLAPGNLKQRYADPQANLSKEEWLSHIGKVRGCKLEGEQIDELRAAKVLLKEFREGKLGRISFEQPETQS